MNDRHVSDNQAASPQEEAPRPGGILGLAVRGAAIRLGATFALKALTFVQAYYFVRWFTPEDFGYRDVAAKWAAAILLFSRAGLSQYILRGEGDQRPVMNVALTLNLAIGCVFALLVAVGGWLGGVITGGTLQGVYVAMMAYTAFSSALALPAVLWERHFKFQWAVLPQFVNFAFQFLLTWIFYRAGYAHTLSDGSVIRGGCLILGSLAGFIASNAFIWIFAPYRPRLGWDWSIVKTLYRFGWPLFFSAVFAFIAWEGDDLFVWFYGDQDEVGLYVRAFFFLMFLATVQDTVCAVLLPALRNAKSRESLEYGFTIANKYMGIVAALGGLLVLTYARPIAAYYYGGGPWMECELMIRIFAVSFFLRTVTGWGWWVLPMIRGDNRVVMWANLAYAIGLLTYGQYLIYRFGGVGGAWANVITVVLLAPFFRCWTIQREFGSLRSLWVVWPAVVAGGAMWVISVAVFERRVTNNYWLLTFLVASSLLFAVIYLLVDRGRILAELRRFAKHGLSPEAFEPEER